MSTVIASINNLILDYEVVSNSQIEDRIIRLGPKSENQTLQLVSILNRETQRLYGQVLRKYNRNDSCNFDIDDGLYISNGHADGSTSLKPRLVEIFNDNKRSL